MSSLAFLVTELQSLASETKRKHPEIREAAEASLAILRSSPEQATANLAADGPQSDALLRPVFMGCATKNAKVVAISLGSLQRLINLKAVPQSAVALIINTMSDAMIQGVDIQLRILQTLLSLITNFPAVHGALLGDALLLCFKLQESRIAVVSSTAAATLRQLVMFVVDKVVDEDRIDSLDPKLLSETTLPDGSILSLAPSARDAFSVFEDLCLLANSEKPHFLKLEFLHKTFALELIESVLTNYHDLFRHHQELLLLLRHHLCPLLLKSLSDRPIFPLTLRCTRVVFLLLKQFSFELETEAEVFLMLLIKIIGEDYDSGAHASELPTTRPSWMRVLAMEIMRGLCSDAELMRNVWARYDSQNPGSKVFTSLITALKRLVTEKPAVLGVGSQIFGLGIQSNQGEPPTSHYGLDVGGVAGMVATAASATVSGVVGMMHNEGGLSVQGSAMKLQCIDQLDKADAPPIPESYLYLLAVQCLVSLCEGFASFTGPLYTSIVMQKPRAAGEPPIRAPPALDLTTLPSEDKAAQQLRIVSDMIESGWPALLAALSFVIATNLSDELFADVLASYQAMTNVSGMLALTTPRDAFFTSLAKFAIPTRVVSSVDSYIEPPTPRSATSLSENLGLSGPVQAPGLSERNMACLKILVSNAMFLAGSLGESWYGVLEALQNADYVLTSKGSQSAPPKRSTSGIPGSRGASGASAGPPGGNLQPPGGSQQQTPRHPLLSDLDADSLQNSIQHLFNASKNLEDSAFGDFVKALCRLSAEMVGMQTDGGAISLTQSGSGSVEDVRNTNSGGLSPISEPAHRRRVSGIHLPRTLRSGDFGINKLGGVLLLNIHRLIYRSPEVAWNTTTAHLLSIIRLPLAPQPIRAQAARVLDEILIVVPRNLTTAGDLQSQVQRRVLDVLAQQVIPSSYPGAVSTSTSMELRRMGLETLHQILQASGHTLVVGWETIFEMLSSVCKPAPTPISNSIDPATEPSLSLNTSGGTSLPLGYNNEKGYASLVKIAFQSLTLVCDSVSSLSPAHLRLCISTLGHFGRQSDTNIALTAAESLLWSVSDAIQSKRKDPDQDPEYSALWMFLLLEVLRICTDARPELRVGAIQTLFRTMQLYGGTLSLETWDECIWKVTFPLLDSVTAEIRRHHTSSPHVLDASESSSISLAQAWDDSKTLALQSIGSIFHDFLTSKIMQLTSFPRAWDVFTNHIQDAVLLDNRAISAPALRCLEKAVKALAAADTGLKPKAVDAKERVWETCDEIGNAVLHAQSPVSPLPISKLYRPFTQESLVAYVDVIRSTKNVSRALDGMEWQLDRLTRLMAILKGVITYPNSPDYRPDVDSLTPVQSVTMDTIESIDLTIHGSPSLVMRDLSEYATLAFLAAFDVPSTLPPHSSQASGKQPPQKRITYIGISKKVMPMLVDLFFRFEADLDIYIDGTLEAILSAYSIPIKLKYDCPAPSKFGKDLPLWKTATTSFLRVVKECSLQMRALGKDVTDDRVEGIWRQVLDVFRGGILSDCSATSAFTLSEQESEENFDLALLSSLEIDVVPHLGDIRVPDELAAQLARFLQKGSKVYEDGFSSPSSVGGSFEKVDLNVYEPRRGYGNTDLGTLVPRERFSYWCIDLLFLICSNTTRDDERSRRRLASLSIPALLDRCRSVLVGYVADEALRGNLPFPRAREEELLYILRKLLNLRLWSGTLWASASSDPSKYCSEQPPMDVTQPPSIIIADAVKRSSIAHLFHFYDVLCDIASLPRKTPSAWVLPEVSSEIEGQPIQNDPGENFGRVEEHDARMLARECLRLIGNEVGLAR